MQMYMCAEQSVQLPTQQPGTMAGYNEDWDDEDDLSIVSHLNFVYKNEAYTLLCQAVQGIDCCATHQHCQSSRTCVESMRRVTWLGWLDWTRLCLKRKRAVATYRLVKSGERRRHFPEWTVVACRPVGRRPRETTSPAR